MFFNDAELIELHRHHDVVQPFVSTKVRTDHEGRGVISWGLSQFGYDFRLDYDIKYVHPGAGVLDPKNPRESQWVHERVKGPFTIPAGGMVLGSSVEYFSMPHDIGGIALGKSTYARCGLSVNITPLEPGWCGYLTIELHNTSSVPVMVYPGEGIAQILFTQLASDVLNPYESTRYQNQEATPTLAGI